MPERLLINRGDHVCLTKSELRGVPVRPGSLARIERGAYGFEVVILCHVCGHEDECYRGKVTDVWGNVPCL